MDAQQDTIDAVVRILKQTKSILFVTGAGLSADSGIPTYRGIGGLYDIELTEEGLPIEEILSGHMLASSPELTWKYLLRIAEAARGSAPNRGHQVIAEIEQHFPRTWVLTQNVDGFHRAAGSQNVIEIHGNMRSLSCTRCRVQAEVDEEFAVEEIPPKCSVCGGVMRPDVVLFEEMLPDDAIAELRQQLAMGFGLVFSVGTSSGFPYIQEPVRMARSMGVPTIEINPDTTVASDMFNYRISMPAANALDEIWRQFQGA